MNHENFFNLLAAFDGSAFAIIERRLHLWDIYILQRDPVTHTRNCFRVCSSIWRKCGRVAVLQGLRPASRPNSGRRQVAGVRPVPLEAEWGVESGVRGAAWRQPPFIRASYVMCQHLSAFSERLNSAVCPLRSPPSPSLAAKCTRTNTVPPCVPPGGGAAAVRSGVICTEWSGLLRNRWLSDHGHCGDVRQGGEGKRGAGCGDQQRLHTWIIHDASHQPTRSEPKWCSGLTGHVHIFSESAKWNWIRVVCSLASSSPGGKCP